MRWQDHEEVSVVALTLPAAGVCMACQHCVCVCVRVCACVCGVMRLAACVMLVSPHWWTGNDWHRNKP